MLGSGAMQSTAMGQLGSDFINDTDAHTGNWGIIYCISACTFAVLTSAVDLEGNALMTGTLTGITMSPGMLIYGNFTTISLGSGKVIAYRL